MDRDLDLNITRAKHHCSMAERSVAEMEKKLQQWKVCDDSIDIIINILKSEGYLSDERFTKAFVSDKFRFNKWGKMKIAHGLKQAGIEKEMIEEGLLLISESDYHSVTSKLVSKKLDALSGEYDPIIVKQKTLASMMAKGFETDFVGKVVDELFKERNIK